MLFVSYLEKESPEQFKKFLIDIMGGEDFSEAFRSSFGKDTMTKWNEFKNHIINSEPYNSGGEKETVLHNCIFKKKSNLKMFRTCLKPRLLV